MDIWDSLAVTLTGKLPADPGSIDQSEINRKVVQLKMLIDTIQTIKHHTKHLFKWFSGYTHKNRWDMVLKYSKELKKHIVNLLKVFITFLEDEQLLMIAIGEDTTSSMQEISSINKELGELLTKIA
jgi:hypothetical protein